MKSDKIIDAIENIDPKIINDISEMRIGKTVRTGFVKIAVIAAALAAIIAASSIAIPLMLKKTENEPVVTETEEEETYNYIPFENINISYQGNGEETIYKKLPVTSQPGIDFVYSNEPFASFVPRYLPDGFVMTDPCIIASDYIEDDPHPNVFTLGFEMIADDEEDCVFDENHVVTYRQNVISIEIVKYGKSVENILPIADINEPLTYDVKVYIAYLKENGFLSDDGKVNFDDGFPDYQLGCVRAEDLSTYIISRKFFPETICTGYIRDEVNRVLIDTYTTFQLCGGISVLCDDCVITYRYTSPNVESDKQALSFDELYKIITSSDYFANIKK